MKACEPVPCPPWEVVEVDVTAAAPVGHRLIEGVPLEGHTQPASGCVPCQDAGGLLEGLEEASARWRAHDGEVSMEVWPLPSPRHPQCVITKEHPAHKMFRSAGERCEGGSWSRYPTTSRTT